MNIQDTVKFGEQYLAQYLKYFIDILLIRPERHFSPVIKKREPDEWRILVSSEQSPVYGINPSLIGFLIISITLCTAIFTIMFHNLKAPDLIKAILVTIFFWFLASSTIHFATLPFRGKATYLETVSYSMGIFSVVYVISSVITVLWASIVTVFDFNYVNVFTPVFEKPIYFYFVSQAILLICYFSIAISRLHRISLLKSMLLSNFIAIVWVTINLLLFIFIGGLNPPIMAYPNPPPKPSISIEHIKSEIIKEVTSIANTHDSLISSVEERDQKKISQLRIEYTNLYFRYRALYLLSGELSLLNDYPMHKFYSGRLQELKGINITAKADNLWERYKKIEKRYDVTFPNKETHGFEYYYDLLRKIENQSFPFMRCGGKTE